MVYAVKMLRPAEQALFFAFYRRAEASVSHARQGGGGVPFT